MEHLFTEVRHFRYEHRDDQRSYAIFLLTENYEITCISDWGSYTYRWNPKGTGTKSALEFFASINGEYLVKKFDENRVSIPNLWRKNLEWHWDRCAKKLREHLQNPATV